MKTIIHYLSKVFLSLILYSTFVLAQDIWQLPLAGSSVSLEYLSPSFLDIYSKYKISMYSILASGKFQLRNNNYLIITIPYVHYHMDANRITLPISVGFIQYGQPEFGNGNIGNLYFAYNINNDNNKNFSTTIGIYLPTASDKVEVLPAAGADYARFLTSIIPLYTHQVVPATGSFYDHDRFALYTPNLVTLRPQFNFYSESSDLFVTITGSPILTYSTKKVSGLNTVDIFLAFSLHGGIKVGDLSAAAGWTGSFLSTGSGQISDRIVDQAGVMVGYKIANIHPELLFRFPLSNNISNVLNYVIGLSARYEF
ncbi:MAG: hypothetical protein JXA06_02115 [Bacteroidetes bacterium]|nr:hypothetical protein [Bacteroidota bacterium]